MKFIHHKKKVVSVAAGLAVVGAVAASAASLGGLTGGEGLGADSVEVTSCDTDGIDFEFAKSYDVASRQYMVDSITLSDIDFDCVAREYEFSVFEKGGDEARAYSGGDALVPELYVRTSGGFSLAGRITFPVNLPVEDVDGVSAFIGRQQFVP